MILPKELFVVAFKITNCFKRSASIPDIFEFREAAERRINEFCLRVGNVCGLNREEYSVIRFVREDAGGPECPNCHRQSLCTSGGHGIYCADIRCKFGWETPVDGDPSPVTMIPGRIIEVLDQVLFQLCDGCSVGNLRTAIALIKDMKQHITRDLPPVERFVLNGVADMNNPGRATEAKPGLPSLTSFQKLVLRALYYLIESTVEVGLEGSGLLADIRRVVSHNE